MPEVMSGVPESTVAATTSRIRASMVFSSVQAFSPPPTRQSLTCEQARARQALKAAVCRRKSCYRSRPQRADPGLTFVQPCRSCSCAA